MDLLVFLFPWTGIRRRVQFNRGVPWFANLDDSSIANEFVSFFFFFFLIFIIEISIVLLLIFFDSYVTIIINFNEKPNVKSLKKNSFSFQRMRRTFEIIGWNRMKSDQENNSFVCCPNFSELYRNSVFRKTVCTFLICLFDLAWNYKSWTEKLWTFYT